MKIYVIESGSKGNATLIENDGRFLLLDMGISWTTLKDALDEIGISIYDVEALLLTHCHSDHTKGVIFIPNKSNESYGLTIVTDEELYVSFVQ